MKKIIYFFLSFLVLCSCARKATDPNQNKVMQFSFRVKDQIILDRNDLTYYVLFYAPKTDDENFVLNPNDGPRINAPDLTKGVELLEGRLPFVGQLPGDQESKWTDFFFITASGGKTIIGRGRKDEKGNPVIYDRNYVNQNTKPLTDTNGKVNGFQIEFFINSLNNGQNNSNTKTITVNLASGDSIDNGFGMIYDNWRNNTPFSLSLISEVQQTEQDINSAIVMRKVVGRPDPALPAAISPDNVNIVEYMARVTE